VNPGNTNFSRESKREKGREKGFSADRGPPKRNGLDGHLHRELGEEGWSNPCNLFQEYMFPTARGSEAILHTKRSTGGTFKNFSFSMSKEERRRHSKEGRWDVSMWVSRDFEETQPSDIFTVILKTLS